LFLLQLNSYVISAATFDMEIRKLIFLFLVNGMEIDFMDDIYFNNKLDAIKLFAWLISKIKSFLK